MESSERSKAGKAGSKNQKSKKRLLEDALAEIVQVELSFPDLLSETEVVTELDDCARADSPFLDLCYSFWCTLLNLRESAQEAEARGRDYPVSFAKTQWLDALATYGGMVSKRLSAGELLLDSEGVTATFRAELAQVRERLLIIYGRNLERLEAQKEPYGDE